MMRLAVFTICSNPDVPRAHVLLGSVARFLLDAERFLVLADRCHPGVSYPEGCEVIAAEALGIPDLEGFTFRYDAMEFSAAVKPFAFLHLLGIRGYTHCLYFDPDIELFSPVVAITEALAGNASFILTPHLLAPAETEGGPDDVTVMRAGAFNLGFLGVSGTRRARDILAWWSRWVRWFCVNDRPIGLFVDQKFMDLVPGFAPDVRILHDPGLNVAYWNLSQRRFAPDAAEGPLVEGGPLGFFHYSGFDPADPDRLSRETDWFAGAALPGAWRMFLAGYADRLLAAGHGGIPEEYYAYGRFASGVPIPAIARRMFRDDYEAWAGNPFENFEAWLHLPALGAVPGLGGTVPSLLMQWLQARTPALAGFSLGDADGAARVTSWWVEQGESIGVDRRLLEPRGDPARSGVVREEALSLDPMDGSPLKSVPMRESLLNAGTTAPPEVETENERLRVALAHAQADLERHGTALAKLQGELMASRLEVAGARGETVHIKGYLHQAERDNAAAHVHIDELRGYAADREAEIARLHAMVAEMQGSVAMRAMNWLRGRR